MENIIKKRSTTSLRLSDQMKIELEEIAISNECSISSVIRYAISNLIEDEQI